MALPVYDPELHDVGLGIAGGVTYGWIRHRQGQVQRADLVPATSRAALGLGQYDNYQVDSFLAQSTLEGGAGQGRFSAGDKALSMLADARPGHLFPQRIRKEATDGGSTSWFVTRRPLGSTPVLHGFVAAHIETIVHTGSTTQVSRSTGTIAARPIVTGSQYLAWTQGTAGSRKLYSYPMTGSATDITSRLGGATSVDVVGLYERAVWALGSGTPTTSPVAPTNFATATASGASNASISFTTPTTTGNLIVLAVEMEDAGTPRPDPQPGINWRLATSSGVGDLSLYVYYYEHAAATTTINVDFSEVVTSLRLAVIEVPGVANASALDVVSATTHTGSAIMDTANATNTQAIGIALGFFANSITVTTASYSAGWTELIDTSSADTSLAVAYNVLSSTASQTTVATASGGGGDSVSLMVIFKGSSAPSGSVQFKAWRSIDEMATWQDAYPSTSTGIGEVRAMYAVGRELYFATSDGLYAISAEEREFEDHQQKINIAIRGRIDRWEVTRTNEGGGTGPDINGRFLDAWDGSLFTNVGSTIRQIPINGVTGSGRQLWPADDWDWVVGEVRCLIAGEDGLYFSIRANATYDVLFRYNGRSFVPLLKAPAGELDALHWFNGRLYTKADPAAFYEFIYPASRPDTAGLAVTDWTTGYAVSSKIDLGKVDQYKVVRKFFTEVEFTALTDSGTVTLEYLIGDTGLHPERYLPDDATITWTSIGTHTVADGNYKEHTLAVPAEFKNIWIRVSLAPGAANGIPILESYGLDGVTLMPPVKVFSIPLSISTGARDRTGNALYPTADDVNAALDQLEVLRYPSTSPRYLTLSYLDDTNTDTDYTVIMERKEEMVTGFSHDASMSAQIQLALREIP